MPIEQTKMLGYRDDEPDVCCMVGNATLETLPDLGSDFKLGDWFLSETIITVLGHQVKIYGPFLTMNDAMQEAHNRFGVTSFKEPFTEFDGF